MGGWVRSSFARITFRCPPSTMTGSARCGTAWMSCPKLSRKTATTGIAAPMEFRFVKGGDTAMSRTFTEDPAEHTWFFNLDLIGFVEAGIEGPSGYPAVLLRFFADVEGRWVEMEASHITARCARFYDPTTSTRQLPLCRSALASWPTSARRQNARLEAFNAYHQEPRSQWASSTAVFCTCAGRLNSMRAGSRGSPRNRSASRKISNRV